MRDIARWSTRVFRRGRIPRCYVTKFAPRKALYLIAWGKLTFDERVVLHRVVPGEDSQSDVATAYLRLSPTSI